MSISRERTRELVKKYGKNEHDTGSSEAQVALFTEQINNISTHLKTNKKDHSGRRGLLLLVSKRRRLLDYLRKRDEKTYFDIIKKLKIRK